MLLIANETLSPENFVLELCDEKFNLTESFEAQSFEIHIQRNKFTVLYVEVIVYRVGLKLVVKPVRYLNRIIDTVSTLYVVNFYVKCFVDFVGQKLEMMLDLMNIDSSDFMANQFGSVPARKSKQSHVSHYSHL